MWSWPMGYSQALLHPEAGQWKEQFHPREGTYLASLPGDCQVGTWTLRTWCPAPPQHPWHLLPAEGALTSSGMPSWPSWTWFLYALLSSLGDSEQGRRGRDVHLWVSIIFLCDKTPWPNQLRAARVPMNQWFQRVESVMPVCRHSV